MKGKGKSLPKKPELNADDQLLKLGKRIRELRVKNGYSSYEYFAYDNEMSRAQIGRYEQGKDIRFSTLVKVISALGLTIEEFFSEGFE